MKERYESRITELEEESERAAEKTETLAERATSLQQKLAQAEKQVAAAVKAGSAGKGGGGLSQEQLVTEVRLLVLVISFFLFFCSS